MIFTPTKIIVKLGKQPDLKHGGMLDKPRVYRFASSLWVPPRSLNFGGSRNFRSSGYRSFTFQQLHGNYLSLMYSFSRLQNTAFEITGNNVQKPIWPWYLELFERERERESRKIKPNPFSLRERERRNSDPLNPLFSTWWNTKKVLESTDNWE